MAADQPQTLDAAIREELPKLLPRYVTAASVEFQLIAWGLSIADRARREALEEAEAICEARARSEIESLAQEKANMCGPRRVELGDVCQELAEELRDAIHALRSRAGGGRE